MSAVEPVSFSFERRRDPVARARWERIRIERRLRLIMRMVPYADFNNRNRLIAEMQAMSTDIDRIVETLRGLEAKTA